MTREDPERRRDPRVGLCAECRHSRRVVTPRSTFWLCERSRTDPSFEKYPRLPILVCPGYEPVEADGAGEAGGP